MSPVLLSCYTPLCVTRMWLTDVPRRADGLCHSAQPHSENHATLGRVTSACGQVDNRGSKLGQWDGVDRDETGFGGCDSGGCHTLLRAKRYTVHPGGSAEALKYAAWEEEENRHHLGGCYAQKKGGNPRSV